VLRFQIVVVSTAIAAERCVEDLRAVAVLKPLYYLKWKILKSPMILKKYLSFPLHFWDFPLTLETYVLSFFAPWNTLQIQILSLFFLLSDPKSYHYAESSPIAIHCFFLIFLRSFNLVPLFVFFFLFFLLFYLFPFFLFFVPQCRIVDLRFYAMDYWIWTMNFTKFSWCFRFL